MGISIGSGHLNDNFPNINISSDDSHETTMIFSCRYLLSGHHQNLICFYNVFVPFLLQVCFTHFVDKFTGEKKTIISLISAPTTPTSGLCVLDISTSIY